MTRLRQIKIRAYELECSCGKVVRGLSPTDVRYKMKRHKMMSKEHNDGKSAG